MVRRHVFPVSLVPLEQIFQVFARSVTMACPRRGNTGASVRSSNDGFEGVLARDAHFLSQNLESSGDLREHWTSTSLSQLSVSFPVP